MVENIDRWVGLYVDELKRRGELDNTIIVFSSDHGEMLGDHDRWGKNVPYDPSLCVPLIVAGPGVKHRGSDALVSLIDVGATFLDYAGAQSTDGMEARSFRLVLEGKADRHRDYINSGLFNWRLVSDGRYKLVRGFDPKIRALGGSARASAPSTYVLYDLQADPLENKNFADSAPNIVARLAQYLPPANTDPRYALPVAAGLTAAQ
jgi:arylsulfatase A-like enzyme